MNIRHITEIVKKSKNVTELYDRIENYIKTSIKEKAQEFYLTGFVDGLKKYAYWENGEGFIGKDIKISEAIKEAKESLKSKFEAKNTT